MPSEKSKIITEKKSFAHMSCSPLPSSSLSLSGRQTAIDTIAGARKCVHPAAAWRALVAWRAYREKLFPKIDRALACWLAMERGNSSSGSTEDMHKEKLKAARQRYADMYTRLLHAEAMISTLEQTFNC